MNNYEKVNELIDQLNIIKNIVNFLPDATFAIDVKGRVIIWNKAIELITGIKAEEILGKNDREYSIPFYGYKRPMLIDLVLTPDESVVKKYANFDRKNGILTAESITKVNYGNRAAYMWGQAAPLIINDIVIGAIQSIRDITNFKRAENALRDSEQRLADIINFLPDATFAINLEGEVIAWNKAVEEMTGIEQERMLGKKGYSSHFYGIERPMLVDLVIRPDEELESQYSHFKRENGTLTAEGCVKVAYGKGIAYMWGKAAPLYDSGGNIVGAIESFRDITEKKQFEYALRNSERRFADIINFLPDATFVVDNKGRVIAWNRALEEMTGYKASDLIGKGNQEYSIPFYGKRRHMLIDFVLCPNPELESLYPNLT